MSQTEIRRGESCVVFLTQLSPRQAFITVRVPGGKVSAEASAEEAYRMVGDILRDSKLEIAHERIFGRIQASASVAKGRYTALTAVGITPPSCYTYIQGRPVHDGGWAGLLLHAVAPDDGMATVFDNGEAVGRTWALNGAVYTTLQSIHGGGDTLSRQRETEQMFARADAILRQQDLDYSAVVRTWLYLSKVLDWYGDLNRGRDVKYREFGLMPELDGDAPVKQLLLPASTGIEGDNLFGRIAVMDALALSGDRPLIRQMANKKQQDAFRYGSSFSRGAWMRESDQIRIEISGTASIDEQGKTVDVGNSSAQIVNTMDAIEALLATEDAGMRHIACATVFLKHAKDIALFEEIAAGRGLSDMPGVFVEAAVCRDDLLFEIDGVAVLPRA